MSDRRVDYLLIGGGMASAHCAAELRRREAEGSILLVGREPDPPYERPPLSKEYMRGESKREDAYVNGADWYEDNDVELLTGTSVMSLDLGARTATLQTKEEVGFSKAVIATGARVNILHHLEGARLEGIHYLRVLGNSEAIREEAEGAEHVVLIGGSYIASEVAASLTATGTKCTMVMLEDVAMSRAFGEEVGRYFHEILESNGIELVPGDELEAFLGEGRVRAIRTKSGREIEGDVVVVGAGVHPDTMLAERAGLQVENGIVCDSKLETSVKGIYRGRRRVLVRQRGAWPAAADRALGRGVAAGTARGGRAAGRGGALPGGAVLLQRPGGLDEPRVRGAGGEVGRDRLAGRPGCGRVQRLVPGGRQGGRGAQRRALGGPGARAAAAGVGRRRVGAEGRAGGRGLGSGAGRIRLGLRRWSKSALRAHHSNPARCGLV